MSRPDDSHALATRPVAYEDDFYAWTQDQAARLRALDAPGIDTFHLAEELNAMGGSEKREIESRLAVLLEHLLKWRHQPGLRSNSWQASIIEARDRITGVIETSPSLRRYPGQVIAKAYRIARLRASDQILPRRPLPEACPFTADEALDHDFWPAPAEPFPE